MGGGENDWMTGSLWSGMSDVHFLQSLIVSLIGDGRVSHGELVSSASLKLAPEIFFSPTRVLPAATPPTLHPSALLANDCASYYSLH